MDDLPRKKRVVDKKQCFTNDEEIISVEIVFPKQLPTNNTNSLY